MENIYFTIAGTKYRYGGEFFKKKMKVELVTEKGIVCKLSKKSKA